MAPLAYPDFDIRTFSSDDPDRSLYGYIFMAVPEWLLDMLVCPERKDLKLYRAESIKLSALNERIRKREVFDRGGRLVEDVLTEGLIREDGLVLYPVIDGIPRLCMEDGIEIAKISRTHRPVA